jgi:uncharacterized protein
MIRQFRWALLLSVVAIGLAVGFGGLETGLVVAILGVLEISVSFDNAVVNATVLRRMDPVWQRLFLTVGVVIAVFGMRLILPLVIVAVTSHSSISSVVDLALNHPDEYGARLAGAYPAVYGFGGTFLLMIFLDFVLDPEREVVWLRPVELALQRIGKLDQLSVIVALGGIYLMSQLAPHDRRATVLVAGIAGLVSYLVVNGLDGLFERSMEARQQEEDRQDEEPAKTSSGRMTWTLFKDGVFVFVYLEVLDASFSFDGVIGAFAISDKVLVIALGLGIGAFWIRSLTLYLVRKGTLGEYIYLEHGAHWAIGVLAAIMLISVRYHVSEAVTGLTGVSFIGLALISSVIERRRQHAADPDLDQPAAAQ